MNEKEPSRDSCDGSGFIETQVNLLEWLAKVRCDQRLHPANSQSTGTVAFMVENVRIEE